MTAISDAGARDRCRHSPPRPVGGAPGLEPDHEPRHRPRRGLVADHDRRPALPRLHVGHRRHQHGSRAPARRRGHPGPGREAAARAAEHRLPRAGPAALRTAGAPAPGRAVVGVPVQLGRGGGRGRGEARARRDRAAGDHRVPLRLPRPDRPGDVADGGEGRLPRRRSSRCRAPCTTPPTRTAIGRRAARTTRRPAPATGRSSSTCCSTSSSTPRRWRRSSSSRSSARAATSSRRRRFLPRLREITRKHGILLIADEVQTGFGRTGRDVRGRALGRRARHRRHGQGHRVGAAAVGDPGAQAS